jgi:hypothetical protein
MAEQIHGRGGMHDITNDYKYILQSLANKLKVPIGSLWIEDHSVVGEDCIYSGNKWIGYTSQHIDELDEEN